MESSGFYRPAYPHTCKYLVARFYQASQEFMTLGVVEGAVADVESLQFIFSLINRRQREFEDANYHDVQIDVIRANTMHEAQDKFLELADQGAFEF